MIRLSEGFSKGLETLFSNMENFVTTKTVVGEAIHMDGVTILPLVDLVFGVGAGGGKEKQTEGGGLAAKISPSAVLVIQNGNVQLVNIKNQDSVNKLIDMVPGLLSKLNFGPFKNKNNENVQSAAVEQAVQDISSSETIITEPNVE